MTGPLAARRGERRATTSRPVGPAAARSTAAPAAARGRPRLHCHACRPSFAGARRARPTTRPHRAVSDLRRPGRSQREPPRRPASAALPRLPPAPSRPARGPRPRCSTDAGARAVGTLAPRAARRCWSRRGPGRGRRLAAAHDGDGAGSGCSSSSAAGPTTAPDPGQRATRAERGHRGARLPAGRGWREVLDELGLLVDDSMPERCGPGSTDRCDALPAGFRTEVRAWLLELPGRRRPGPAAVGVDDLRLLRARPAAPAGLVADPRAPARGHRGRRHARAGRAARAPPARARSPRCSRCSASPSATVWCSPIRPGGCTSGSRPDPVAAADDRRTNRRRRAYRGHPGAAAGRRAGRGPRRPRGRDPAADPRRHRPGRVGASPWPVARNGSVEFVHQVLLEWLQQRQPALAPHPEPARARLRSHRDRHRAGQRLLPELAPAAARCPARADPRRPGSARSARRPGRSAAPGGAFDLSTATAIDYADIARALSPAPSSTARPAPDTDLRPGSSSVVRAGRELTVTNWTRSASGGAEEGRVPTTRVSRRLNSSGSEQQDMRKSMLPPRCGDVVARGTGAFPGFASRQRVPRTCASRE